MCGIAGAFSFRNDAQRLDLELIQHRGPDSRGEWNSPDRRVWLGMTRLAILDLSPTGNQPMIDPINGNVIIQNGEIYNHLSIRHELEALGAAFRGTSDTETLLVAYRFWQEAMLSRLKGMFAFAIYDSADNSIFLARDRFGIKPLYYFRGKDRVNFASEVRPIVRIETLRPTRESIIAYLQWGCCPHSALLYPEISEMPVASHLRIRANQIGEPTRYWSPSKTADPAPPTNGRNAIVRKIREFLEASVHDHILSDVPVACFLSGGVDSSVVTALAARELHRDLHTFSVCFEAAAFDEGKYARRMAADYQTDHVEIRLRPEEVIETTKEAVLSMDLPSIDAINSYIVAKEVARNGFKVALSGLGGDELFGGYSHFQFIRRLKYLALIPRPLLYMLLQLKKGRHLLSDIPPGLDAGLFAQWWRRLWNSSMLRDAGFPARSIPLEPRPELIDDFAKISWSELSHYMRDMLLRDSDQMAMAVSLEIRVPFLDHELVEFVLGLPSREKERRGLVKSLLVDSVRDLIPSEVYDRKKMGFELPMAEWMRGPLRQFTLDGLRNVADHGVLARSHVLNLGERFNSGKLAWQKLWALVILGWYLQKENLPKLDEASSFYEERTQESVHSI
jgi:asparagine synthase (glutamine-hydrolysing)